MDRYRVLGNFIFQKFTMAKAKRPNLCYRLNGIVGVHPLWTIGNDLFKPSYINPSSQ
jgi:hypothetical protein